LLSHERVPKALSGAQDRDFLRLAGTTYEMLNIVT
jgi:hypothetical protein